MYMMIRKKRVDIDGTKNLWLTMPCSGTTRATQNKYQQRCRIGRTSSGVVVASSSGVDGSSGEEANTMVREAREAALNL